MLVRSWGSRGSIPVSGQEYLKYGGDTPCLEVRSRDGQTLIVDSGTGIRRLGKLLSAEGITHFDLCFTHSHWDHIIGFPFFRPIYDAKTFIRLHGCPMTQGNIRDLLAKTMESPYFPVNFGQIAANIQYLGLCQAPFSVGSVSVDTIPISHPNLGLGYKFIEDKRTVVFLTDNELGYQHRGGQSFADYVAFCHGADLLIHDAEYTEDEYLETKTWGHSTYTDALRLALQAEVKAFGLYHHNQWRCDDEIDRLVADCRRLAKKAGRDLDCFAVGQETVFKYGPTSAFVVK